MVVYLRYHWHEYLTLSDSATFLFHVLRENLTLLLLRLPSSYPAYGFELQLVLPVIFFSMSWRNASISAARCAAFSCTPNRSCVCGFSSQSCSCIFGVSVRLDSELAVRRWCWALSLQSIAFVSMAWQEARTDSILTTWPRALIWNYVHNVRGKLSAQSADLRWWWEFRVVDYSIVVCTVWYPSRSSLLKGQNAQVQLYCSTRYPSCLESAIGLMLSYVINFGRTAAQNSISPPTADKVWHTVSASQDLRWTYYEMQNAVQLVHPTIIHGNYRPGLASQLRRASRDLPSYWSLTNRVPLVVWEIGLELKQ